MTYRCKSILRAFRGKDWRAAVKYSERTQALSAVCTLNPQRKTKITCTLHLCADIETCRWVENKVPTITYHIFYHMQGQCRILSVCPFQPSHNILSIYFVCIQLWDSDKTFFQYCQMQNTTSGSQERRCCQYQIEEAALKSRWTLNSLQITKQAEAPNVPQNDRKNGGSQTPVSSSGNSIQHFAG